MSRSIVCTPRKAAFRFCAADVLLLTSLLLVLSQGCAASTATPQTTPKVATKPGEELAKKGMDLARQGDDFGAEQYLEAAIKAGYDEGPATRVMVATCISGGRLERARTHAQLYVDRHPDDWIFHHVLATIYFAEGQPVVSREILTVLLAEHPDHAPSHFLLGLVLRDQMGDMDGARLAFEQYLALEPAGEHQEEARAWLRRARAFPVLAESKAKRR